MLNITDKEPDFVNDDGIKWWKHDYITKYANTKGLKDTIGYIVESETGYKTFLLINNTGILEEDSTLEGIGTKIDMIAFLIRGDDEKKNVD